MKSAVTIKPIEAYTEIKEEKYVKEIFQSLSQKPSKQAIQINNDCINLLRKARRG